MKQLLALLLVVLPFISFCQTNSYIIDSDKAIADFFNSSILQDNYYYQSATVTKLNQEQRTIDFVKQVKGSSICLVDRLNKTIFLALADPENNNQRIIYSGYKVTGATQVKNSNIIEVDYYFKKIENNKELDDIIDGSLSIYGHDSFEVRINNYPSFYNYKFYQKDRLNKIEGYSYVGNDTTKIYHLNELSPEDRPQLINPNPPKKHESNTILDKYIAEREAIIQSLKQLNKDHYTYSGGTYTRITPNLTKNYPLSNMWPVASYAIDKQNGILGLVLVPSFNPNYPDINFRGDITKYSQNKGKVHIEAESTYFRVKIDIQPDYSSRIEVIGETKRHVYKSGKLIKLYK
ncbi:MAG: hypothetical protein R2800_03980 [Flavipsychrobacter sp.]